MIDSKETNKRTTNRRRRAFAPQILSAWSSESHKTRDLCRDQIRSNTAMRHNTNKLHHNLSWQLAPQLVWCTFCHSPWWWNGSNWSGNVIGASKTSQHQQSWLKQTSPHALVSPHESMVEVLVEVMEVDAAQTKVQQEVQEHKQSLPKTQSSVDWCGSKCDSEMKDDSLYICLWHLRCDLIMNLDKIYPSMRRIKGIPQDINQVCTHDGIAVILCLTTVARLMLFK